MLKKFLTLTAAFVACAMLLTGCAQTTVPDAVDETVRQGQITLSVNPEIVLTYDENQDKYLEEGGRYTIFISKNVNTDILSKNIEIKKVKTNHEYNYLKEYKDGSFKLLSDDDFLASLNYEVKLSNKKMLDKKKKIILVDKNTLIMDLVRCKSLLVRTWQT